MASGGRGGGFIRRALAEPEPSDKQSVRVVIKERTVEKVRVVQKPAATQRDLSYPHDALGREM